MAERGARCVIIGREKGSQVRACFYSRVKSLLVRISFFQSFDSVDVFDVLLSQMSARGQFPCSWHTSGIIMQSKCSDLLRCYHVFDQCFLDVMQTGINHNKQWGGGLCLGKCF